ncbi:hypothetical protein [Salinisphaera japonica]|uniref:hypothetical protein n=1 Tax=Salinisphaera japonica TaxID=1304270 RepID=UPI000F4C305D|nr:hypothetical protein [Salinisphaera japonica]
MATVTGAAINIWRENRTSKQSTKYDALVAAVALEGYAINCADKISAHKAATWSEGHAGAFMASVPKLPELSVTAGYLRHRKASVANQLMTFPQDVNQAEQAVAFWWDVVGDEEATKGAAVQQSARIGLQSLNLAKVLRDSFSLPKRHLVFGEYDIHDVLNKELPKDE